MDTDKTFTNILKFKTLNESLDIPTHMIVLSDLKDYKHNANIAYISTKGSRSNAAAVSKFIKHFIKTNRNIESYVCRVVQNKLWKPDTVEFYYKELK